MRDIRRLGAAAVDLCSVAGGRLDAYYEQGLAPWDLAAGARSIAREAGAVVADLDGDPVTGLPLPPRRPRWTSALEASCGALAPPTACRSDLRRGSGSVAR